MRVIPSAAKTGVTFDAASIRGVDTSRAVKDHLARYTATYTEAEKAIIATAYSAFVAAGLHTALDQFAFAAGNTADSLMNWIVGGPTATNSGLAFAAGQGWSGDGTAKFISTGFTPSSGSPQYSLDSASACVFMAATPALTNVYGLGQASGSLRTGIIPDGTASNSTGRLNSSTTMQWDNPGFARGALLLNRLDSASVRAVDDGELRGTVANVSSTVPTVNMIIGGNAAGTATYTAGRIGGWAFGGGLSRQQEVTLCGVMNWLARVWAVA